MTNTLYVICHEPGPRIRYVFEHIRIQWNLDELKFLDKNTISEYSGERIINYSTESHPSSSIHFVPSSVIESGNRIIPEQIEWVDKLPYFFRTNTAGGIQGFDLPGMIFFMLSRVEEFDHQNLDSLRRLEGKNSFAARNGFLHIPVVDLWLQNMAQLYFAHPKKNGPARRDHLTIDIDIAWAFSHRPLWEYLGGAFKEVFSFKWKKLGRRIRTLMNLSKDPFDVYDYLNSVQDQHGAVQFFILLGERAQLDRSFHWNNPRFIALIKKLNLYSDVGIHPSTQASGNLSILIKEIQRLENIIEQTVEKSRQHYLLLNLPGTYRDLLSAGIKEDYTMGFHDLPGCRAGTVYPFYWYDSEDEKITSLKVYPFYVMDVTLKNYMKLNAFEAADWMQNHKDLFVEWNLPMTLVWHNSSFFEEDGWNGWKEVLEIIFPLK